jgi:type IV pilus assembly protein PilA
MRKSNQGFTLIELMIVVAIIGILASLAVSTYQTYTVRAQIAEGLNMAAGAKSPVVEAYTNDGIAPANRTAAGMSPLATDTAGNFVSAVDIVDGQIVVTMGGPRAHQAIMGLQFSLTPYETVGTTVSWRCGYAPAPTGSLLPPETPHVDPTIEARYLPGACRP